MTLIAETVPLHTGRVIGIDTTTKLTRASVRTLSAANIAYCMRYVSLTNGGWNDATLSSAEVDEITGEGMPLMVVQFARTSGWSAVTGRSDGAAAAINTQGVRVPPDVCLTCDLEGHLLSQRQALDYANAWHEGATTEGGTDLQIYVGAGVPLTSGQLYHDLRFKGYMRSGSIVPDVDMRGYRMIQLDPLDQMIGGVLVDLSVVQSDHLGGRPRWARAA
jgi:hypothetical protein